MLLRDPPSSTYPAGLAIAAVGEQGDPGPFIDAARETVPTHPGLDIERLRVDFGSNAIVERFGSDIERGRGVRTPTVEFATGERVEGTGCPTSACAPRAPAELWRLALEGRVKPRRAGGGDVRGLA